MFVENKVSEKIYASFLIYKNAIRDVIKKYKTRLVVKDFTQKLNIDYFVTFVPMTRISPI